MASILNNYVDADGQLIQPYFAAFMIEKGYTRAKHIFERDGHPYEYTEWNRKAWAEFERACGHPVDHYGRIARSADFTEWLNDRCLDIEARRFVEAA